MKPAGKFLKKLAQIQKTHQRVVRHSVGVNFSGNLREVISRLRRCVVVVMFAVEATALASTNNYARNRPVTVSSTYTTNYGSNAVDGVVSDASRWLGAPASSNWLEINFTTNVTLAQAHLYTGYQTQSGSWITNIQLQAWSGSTWTNIPGGAITNTNSFAYVLTFTAPVTADRLRLLTTDTTFARLREITLWDDAQPLYTGVTGDYVPGSALLGAPVLVNQIGYQLGAPKRFTAPTVTNGSPFSITTTNSTNALYSGSIFDGRADFSNFEPTSSGPYVIRVSGATNGTSFPFLILSNLISAKYTVPAAQFMSDSRSGVGTHKSAFGGCPWRDGTYYSFEIPSLIYLLLNDRATIEAVPREVNYVAEKSAVLATNFPFVTTTEDSGFLAALRSYYTNQPPPLTTNLPDAVQAIHFGLGVTLERPATRDWSGDERPRQIHAQTVEWGAYFLHAWPVLRNWLDDGFYRNVRDFTFAQWGISSGLTNATASDDDPSSLEIDPLWAASSYGTVDKHPYKGRHAPGHSILPNLLMYQVAQREGRSDATNYLNAARTQAQWIIDNLDWADPRTTKGHRMSEHKMMPGLVYFATQFPNDAPPGLVAKIQSWADTMMARSDNLWDFRMYETNDFNGDGLVDWSLPKFTQNWNEPGNLAGFPACALAAKQVVTNSATRQRLTEVSWATMDCLFGRNPLNACSASRLSLGFSDAEVGWTPVYSGSAGYLDLCRGALASGPATEHFPYNPAGAKRHNEGWVNFNASWNVGLSFMLADLNGLGDTLEVHLPIVVSEICPAPANPLAEFIELWNPTPYPARLSGLTIGGGVSFAFPTNTFTELAAGARCLLVRNVAAFTNQFGAGLPVLGTFTGDLADAGEMLTLGDVNGNTFAAFDYANANLVAGYSLVFTGTETNFPGGDAWRRSLAPGGSPGTAELTPANFVANAVSWTEIFLTWTESITNETCFVIERAGTNGVWETVITTSANTTSARDCGLTASAAYAYRLRAVFADGGSSDAVTATATTLAPVSRPPIRILPLGDSITLGASQPAWIPGGYRDPLHTLLTNAGYQIQFVGSDTNNPTAALTAAGNKSHEGHGSYTTSNLLANFDSVATGPSANNGGFWLAGISGGRAPVYPDVILLMAGVNDLGVNQFPPEVGLAGLDALINKLATLRPAAHIIVSTLTPYIGVSYPNREANQQTFNAALPALVAAHQAAGHRVTLCDVRTRLNLTNAAALLCSDGVHPNQAGYNEIAPVWFEAIQKLPLVEVWRTKYFGTPTNTGNAADTADADGDGQRNLAEFYFGSNPTNAASVFQPWTSFINVTGTNYLSVTFARRKNSDVRCVVEVVPEISGATPWTNQVIQVGAPVSLDADFEQVTFRDTVPMNVAPTRFMRVSILQP